MDGRGWNCVWQEGLKEAVAILEGFRGPVEPGWARGTLGLSFERCQIWGMVWMLWAHAGRDQERPTSIIPPFYR